MCQLILCIASERKVDFLGKERQLAFGERRIKGKALIQLQITQWHIKTNETLLT